MCRQLQNLMHVDGRLYWQVHQPIWMGKISDLMLWMRKAAIPWMRTTMDTVGFSNTSHSRIGFTLSSWWLNSVSAWAWVSIGLVKLCTMCDLCSLIMPSWFMLSNQIWSNCGPIHKMIWILWHAMYDCEPNYFLDPWLLSRPRQTSWTHTGILYSSHFPGPIMIF